MSDELLAPLDLVFWHLESTDHPMHLGALATFEPTADTDARRAARLLATRAAAHPGLRVRVRDVLLPPGGAAWVTDDSFDVRHHVRLLRLPGVQNPSDTLGPVGELMARPLDRRRPPWEIHVIEGPTGGPFSVLVKLHHALADGLRAFALGAALLDQGSDLMAARAPGSDSPAETRTTPREPWPDLRQVLPAPSRLAGMARTRWGEAGRALGIGAAVLRAALDVRNTPALAAASPSGTRGVGTAVLDLADVNRVRRTSGGTVNDVLLAVVAGGLRRWMLARGETVDRVVPRALIPVSRRRPGHTGPGGNRLSGYLLDLPVGESDPLARLRTVRRSMDRNKAAGPFSGPGAVALLADHVPALAHRISAPLLGNAARLLFDLLVTSVPLPGLALSLGGCPLREMYPLAPLARGQNLALALSTYRGRVHVGLVADGKALPDIGCLAGDLRAALEELTQACAAQRTAPAVRRPSAR